MTPTTNIVRLPTAASRKPQNNTYAAQRIAARAMRENQPFPYMHPHSRQAMHSAAVIIQTNRTPAMHMVIAILECMELEQRRRIIAKLKRWAATGDGAKVAAHEVARMTALNCAEAYDMAQALGLLLEDAQ